MTATKLVGRTVELLAQVISVLNLSFQSLDGAWTTVSAPTLDHDILLIIISKL